MIVPHDRLSPDALAGLIDEFVTRDGTDLADADTKAAQVQRALEQGRVVVVFDPDDETCSIRPADDARRDAARHDDEPDARHDPAPPNQP